MPESRAPLADLPVTDGPRAVDAAAPLPATPTRRMPTQERSRRRVEQILDAAERAVLERGVDDLTTRDIARTADMAVASLYQYFGDKEEVLLALAARDMAEMDDQVAADVAALPVLSVASIVEATIGAFTTVHRRRPAFVMIYLRGRTNVAVARFGRHHNGRVAALLRQLALDAGLCDHRLTPAIAELAVEVGDRVLQLAYEHDLAGDDLLIEQATVLLTGYLERFATPAGLAGVPQ